MSERLFTIVMVVCWPMLAVMWTSDIAKAPRKGWGRLGATLLAATALVSSVLWIVRLIYLYPSLLTQ